VSHVALDIYERQTCTARVPNVWRRSWNCPIMLLFGPLVAVGFAVFKLRSQFVAAFEWIKAAATDAFNWVKEAVSKLKSFFMDSTLGKALTWPFQLQFQIIKKVIWGIEKIIGLKDTLSGRSTHSTEQPVRRSAQSPPPTPLTQDRGSGTMASEGEDPSVFRQ
jgi:hypothetical protein